MNVVFVLLAIGAAYLGFGVAVYGANYLSNGKAVVAGIAYIIVGPILVRLLGVDLRQVVENFGPVAGPLASIVVLVHAMLLCASLFSIGGIGHYVRNKRVAANNSLQARRP